MLYQVFQDEWCEFESASALGISTSVVFLYMRARLWAGTMTERDLVQSAAGVECVVTSLRGFLWFACNVPIEQLGYPCMLLGCNGGGALLYILLDSFKSWYALEICSAYL